jgi:hypothetical protein
MHFHAVFADKCLSHDNGNREVSKRLIVFRTRGDILTLRSEICNAASVRDREKGAMHHITASIGVWPRTGEIFPTCCWLGMLGIWYCSYHICGIVRTTNAGFSLYISRTVFSVFEKETSNFIEKLCLCGATFAYFTLLRSSYDEAPN